MSSPPKEHPFTVQIPDASLDDLKSKLASARLPSASNVLGATGWAYGVPLNDIERLVNRWRNGYDWRAAEAQINATLPQFTRDIAVDGHGVLNVHYVHKKSDVAGAIPLLFVHGWPGHFLEVQKILPLLTFPPSEENAKHPAFHVVAIGLPGFGFSQAPQTTGFSMAQYVEVSHKLMLELGYDEYVVQGGDWGHHITKWLAHHYGPKHVKAWHTNFPIVTRPTFTRNPLLYLTHLFKPYTAFEKRGIERSKWFASTGRGYFAEQSTQPQTLAFSLEDSPVGLLAWIYEKLVLWTDDYKWEDDEVLTWISIYWFSRAGPGAASNIYCETGRAGDWVKPWRIAVPTGFSYFPKELHPAPRTWARTIGNVVFESQHESGGHFAAHEKPEELVGDLRKMFGKGGPAFGVVPGQDGYEVSGRL